VPGVIKIDGEKARVGMIPSRGSCRPADCHKRKQ